MLLIQNREDILRRGDMMLKIWYAKSNCSDCNEKLFAWKRCFSFLNTAMTRLFHSCFLLSEYLVYKLDIVTIQCIWQISHNMISHFFPGKTNLTLKRYLSNNFQHVKDVLLKKLPQWQSRIYFSRLSNPGIKHQNIAWDHSSSKAFSNHFISLEYDSSISELD